MQAKPLEHEPKLSAFSPVPAKDISQLEKALVRAEADAEQKDSAMYELMGKVGEADAYRKLKKLEAEEATDAYKKVDALYQKARMASNDAREAMIHARTALELAKKRKRDDSV